MILEALRIGSISAEAGTKRTGFFKVLELQDGSPVAYPLILINGQREGPILYTGAAFHGDEVNGVESIRRITNEISPEEIAGAIIAVSIQNPLAFHAGNRLPINQIVRSPIDEMPADMHSIFPGKIDGNTFEMMVHRLYNDVISRADYVIDMHQPTTGAKYVPIAFTSLSGNKDTVEKSEDLARAFGTDFVVKTSRGGYAKKGNMHVYAALSGIPSIMVELGEGGRLEEEYIQIGVRGINNVLKHLGMIDGKPEPTKQITIKEMIDVRAHESGILLYEMDLGQKVSKGDLVAKIVNPIGHEIESITSPVAGILLRKTTFPTIISGERVAVFGI
ncbi:MAG: hypothetical protein GTN80_05570 [Nitrososphaeria archaeon]|nr:hypothetical protein [Nitrososphaeria archaeon]NIQ33092.1 hypothetical protein [Nitrososphaeria archaeon]